MTVLSPGDTLGILGGGQLGRMLALAAAPLGLKVAVLAPEADAPAFDVCATRITADYRDAAALASLARIAPVVTYEFENVPAETAAALAAAGAAVRPGARALAITQDRLTEKRFVEGLGIAVAPFAAVDDEAGLLAALDAVGRPAILKTRRFGYDGKGQVAIRRGDDPAAAFAAIGRAPAVLEGFVPFAREVSVVAARGLDGEIAAWEVCENVHRDHILHTTTVPATLPNTARREALAIAGRIAEGLDFVGVLAVEMFVVETAGATRLIVNEIAPRVHNSGHWTIEGAHTSQFEQHVRAVAGWPLGDVGLVGAGAVMTNLIGEEAGLWRTLLAEPGAHLHLYGKKEARPGRKMGHVTRVAPL